MTALYLRFPFAEGIGKLIFFNGSSENFSWRKIEAFSETVYELIK
jgi:hypothetical protein